MFYDGNNGDRKRQARAAKWYIKNRNGRITENANEKHQARNGVVPLNCCVSDWSAARTCRPAVPARQRTVICSCPECVPSSLKVALRIARWLCGTVSRRVTECRANVSAGDAVSITDRQITDRLLTTLIVS